MKKVLIIALDSLDYDIVHRGDHKYLKQAEYGYVDVNVGSLFTPVVWASFITGKLPEKHNVKTSKTFEWDNSYIENLKGLLVRLGLKRLNYRGIYSCLFNTLGFKKIPVLVKIDQDTETIFDLAKKPLALNVPSYNEGKERLRFKTDILSGFHSLKKAKYIEQRSWDAFRDEMKKALNLIQGNWDLFMVHFQIADEIQHLFFFDEDRIRELYEEMDRSAGELILKVDDDCLILIVSDHGQKRGIHTPIGFYSSNKIISQKPSKITDFYELIRSYLLGHSKKELERVKEHLKQLGYL